MSPENTVNSTSGDRVEYPLAPFQELDDVPKDAWGYGDVMGSVAPAAPKWKKLPKVKFLDQSASPDTKMACSRFALAHVSNVQNAVQYSSLDLQVDPAKLWAEYVKQYPLAKDVGATMISATDEFRKLGLISGYLVCRTVDEVKAAIDAGRFIYTGSRKGDWAKTKETKVYKVGQFPCAHITAYFGYNTKYVFGVNSYGEDDGLFAVEWPTFMSPEFMTKLAICDRSDVEPLLQYRLSRQ